MAGPRKLTKGTRVPGIPADSWNAFVDATRKINQLPVRGNGPGMSSGPDEQVQVLVRNDTGADLESRFPIVRLDQPLVTPVDTTDEAGVALRGVQFDGAAPTDGTDFVVMQGPCPDGEMRPAMLMGLTWCLVDVQDAGHAYATAVAGDSDKLKSSAGGVAIKWKESGTGEKLAIIHMKGQSEETPTLQALLFKELPAMIKSVTIADPDTTSTGFVNPGALVERCVMPIEFEPAPLLERDPGDNLNHIESDGETVLYDAVNACWDTDLNAGDGAEQTSGEPPEGTGVYNEPPMLVEGYLRDYAIEQPVDPEDPEGEMETIQKQYFVVTDVINPCVIYEATLNAAMASTDGSVQVTPTIDIWGKRPVGTRTAENVHAWDAASGATATVLRGYDRDTLLNVDCP